MHEAAANDQQQLVANAEAAIAQNRAAAENAEKNATEAKDRIERLNAATMCRAGFRRRPTSSRYCATLALLGAILHTCG